MADWQDEERQAEEGSRLGEARAIYQASPTPLGRAVTRLSGKNQITIPVAMVRALGLVAGDEIELEQYGEVIRMEKKLTRNEALRRLRGSLHAAWPNRESADNYARAEREAWERGWDRNRDSRPSAR